MLFAPKWSKKLHSILNSQQISELEKLRKKYYLTDELFFLGVTASSEFGKLIIKRDYNDMQKKWPNLSKKEIFLHLLKYENYHAQLSDCNQILTSNQIERAMMTINTLDDLCGYIVGLEKKEQPLYYQNEICQQIESIIKNSLL